MTEQDPSPSESLQRGLATRRAVLGDAYVDAALKRATPFDRPLQQYLGEQCWDGIWNRPGLDRRSRSLLNLGMLAALNRPQELRLHIRGAVNNGVTVEELTEVFLQVAMYCGAPAALDGFRCAREVLTEMGLIERAPTQP